MLDRPETLGTDFVFSFTYDHVSDDSKADRYRQILYSTLFSVAGIFYFFE
jgi:hypothetical protein